MCFTCTDNNSGATCWKKRCFHPGCSFREWHGAGTEPLPVYVSAAFADETQLLLPWVGAHVSPAGNHAADCLPHVQVQDTDQRTAGDGLWLPGGFHAVSYRWSLWWCYGCVVRVPSARQGTTGDGLRLPGVFHAVSNCSCLRWCSGFAVHVPSARHWPRDWWTWFPTFLWLL